LLGCVLCAAESCLLGFFLQLFGFYIWYQCDFLWAKGGPRPTLATMELRKWAHLNHNGMVRIFPINELSEKFHSF
jgi:hypothetical protein